MNPSNALPASLSPEDLERVKRVESLARAAPEEGIPALVALLIDPSWAVRRAVVAALASAGAPAVAPIVDILLHERSHEGRLAAAVDALVASRADLDATMIGLARNATLAIVCDAVQVLGRRRAHAAVPLLCELSAHGDDNVAVGAIEALGRIGGTTIVDALVAAVEARHFFRTFPALDALGRTGDARAVPAIVALLSDPLYAPEAARALGRTGQESAVPALAQLLIKPPDVLVRTAAAALAELRERYEARFGDSSSIARALADAIDPSVASRRLAAVLPGIAPSELVALARVFGWLGDTLAIEQLIELAVHEEPVASASANALRRLGAAPVPQILAAIRIGDSARRLRLLPIVGYAGDRIDDLLVCLADPDADVRVKACEALARLGNPASVSDLFRLIGDRDARVSQAAAAAIQSLGSLETKRLALEQARSSDLRTRRAALRIVSYFGYPEGLDVLVAAMGDEDEKIREAAIYGLPLIDDPKGTAALLSAADHATSRTRGAIMRALGQTSSAPSVVGALLRGMEDEDAWVRYYACQSLGKLRVASATDRIIAAMEDPSGQVRVAAVEALAHVGGDQAASALESAARSTDADMRRAALVGLGISRRASAVPILREASSASDTATRLVAIGALSEFDGHDVVPTLAHAASDPDEGIRNAAIGYLSTRPGADATAALIQQLDVPEIRERAIDALAVAADQRIDGLLAALESTDADRAPLLVAALMRMRRPSSQAAIAAALAFDNVHARRAAASALAALATPEAREALARAGTVDPDPDVRRICAAAVSR